MLVLSRKANQRIVIGENIEVVVVAVRGGRVTLGFNAPSDVPIHREEVHRRVQSENGDASSTLAALAEAEMVLADLRQTEYQTDGDPLDVFNSTGLSSVRPR